MRIFFLPSGGASLRVRSGFEVLKYPVGLVRPTPPTEEQLWSYLVQLTVALRAAHSARRALRAPSLLPSKVLLTSPGRIRVGEAPLSVSLLLFGTCVLFWFA